MNVKFMAAAMTAMGLLAGPGIAMADGVKVGVLRCDVDGGLGLIITSSKAMDCTFHSERGGSERYSGVIQKFGLDIGATSHGVLAWEVFAPETGRSRGALSGEYAGVDASASVGIGAGVNALVGGSGRTITLQPISIEVQSGIALAAGVASLTLRPAG